jgi:hypothetical protein
MRKTNRNFPSQEILVNQRFSGGQGRNRTTDTRVFSPPIFAPRNTQEHLK